jgi:hypothetical protein
MSETDIFIDRIKYRHIRDAANAAGISSSYLSKFCREGEVRATRIDGVWFVNETSLRDLLDTREARKREWHDRLTAERIAERSASASHPKRRATIEADAAPLPRSRVAPRTLHRVVAERHERERAAARRTIVTASIASLLFVGSLGIASSGFAPTFASRDASVASISDVGSAVVRKISSFFGSFFASNDVAPTITEKTVTQPATVNAGDTINNTTNNNYVTNNNYIQTGTASGNVSEQLIEGKLSALENYLTGRIDLLAYEGMRQTEDLADDLSNGIGGGGFEDIDITDSSFTGGTISGATLSGVAFSGESDFSSLTTTVATATNATSSTLYVSGSFGFGTSTGLMRTTSGVASTLTNGSNGQVLKMVGGSLAWSTDLTGGGGGGASFFASTTDDLAIYPADPTDVIIIGDSATTSVGYILEVAGDALLRGGVTTYGPLTASRFVATSSTSSVFPHASTTVLSATSLCLDTDCRTSWPTGISYPFSLSGNATSTLTQFNGGLTAFASSTIGNGTAAGGLTISGTATTSRLIVNSTATSTFAGGILMSGSIVPSADDTYSLGSPSFQWRDVYIGPGSLYINGQKVIEDDGPNIVVTADPGQNIAVQSQGSGDIELSPLGTGVIQLKGDVQLTAGNALTMSDNSAVSLLDGAALGNITISGNTITATNINGGIEIAPAGNGSTYITAGNLGIGTTSPGSKLSVAGNMFITGNIISTSTTASQFPYASTTALSTSSFCLSGDCRQAWPTDNAFATTSADYWKSVSNFFSTTSADYWGSTKGYATFSYLFPSNATSTALTFNGGLLSLASTTIGNGTQTGGLTISGGATTTGHLKLSGTAANIILGSNYLSGDGDDEGVFVGSSGNVGVGTTTPAVRLHLYESGNTILKLDGPSDVGHYIDFSNENSTVGYVGKASGSEGIFLAAKGATNFLDFQTGTGPTTRMRIDANGSIGIGSTTPWGKLSITNASSDPSFVIEDQASPDASPFLIDSSGRVGIGTSTPFVRLDVSDGTGVGAISMGADVNLHTKSASTRKVGRLVAPGYTTPANNFLLIGADFTGATANNLFIGGETGASTYAVNNIIFSTEAADNTTGGTERMRLTGAGFLGIGTSTPWGSLSVHSTAGTPQFIIGSSTTQFIVDKNGNVGISTTSPDYSLTISSAYAGDGIRIDGTGSNAPGFTLSTGGVRGPEFGLALSASHFLSTSVANDLVIDTNLSSNMLLGTGGTERMRINSSGNVGIGDTTPASLFTVGNGDLFQVTSTGAISSDQSINLGSSLSRIGVNSPGDIAGGDTISTFDYNADGTALLLERADTSVTAFSLTAYKARGSTASESVITTGDDLLYFRGYGYDGNSFTESSRITFSSEGTIADNQIPGQMLFYTANSAGSLTQRLEIGSDGIATFAGAVSVGSTLTVGSFTSSGTAALCWDNSGASLVNDCSGTPVADYAESYPIDESMASSTSYGYIMMTSDEMVDALDGTKVSRLVKARPDARQKVIGITSDNYFDFTSTGHELFAPGVNRIPVALAGRVPVRVNLEGGPIQVGDVITLSSVPGVGTKATTTAVQVGVALESYTGSSTNSTVLVFVDNGTYIPPNDLEALTPLAQLLATSSAETISHPLLTNLFSNIFARISLWLADASNGITEIFAKTLRAENVYADTVTADEICVKKSNGTHVCVTGDQLEAALGSSNNTQLPPPAPDPEPEPEAPQEDPENTPPASESPEASPEPDAEAPPEETPAPEGASEPAPEAAAETPAEPTE